MKRTAVVLVLAVTVVVGCQSEPPSIPLPEPSSPPTTTVEPSTPSLTIVAAECPRTAASLGLSGPGTPDPVALGAEVKIDSIIWCTSSVLLEPLAEVEERVVDPSDALRQALLLPDGPPLPSNQACPLMGSKVLYLLAVLPQGGAFRIRPPQDDCGEPLPEVTSALEGSKYTVRSSFEVTL